MRKSRFSEAQIIAALREQDAGSATDAVCRKLGVSQQTFYRWKARVQRNECLRCPEAEGVWKTRTGG